MITEEEETLNQSPNRANDANNYFQLPELEDIPNIDGLALESTTFNSQIQDEFTVSELEQKLVNELTKLKIDDMEKLSEKIQQTKERIKSYQEDDKEEADKEMQILTQSKHLMLFHDTITKLKSTESVEDSSSVMEIYRLEQKLINELAKLKVDDVNNLSERIQSTETLMNDCCKDDKEEEIENITEILMKMKHMTLLENTITKLKTTESVEESNNVIETCWYEQELISQLAKLNIPKATVSKRSLTISDHEVESNDHFISSEGNKRCWSSSASYQSAKRSRTESEREPASKFFARLSAVNPIDCKELCDKVKKKCRELCEWNHYRFAGPHFVYMHLGNYKRIFESPYLITWKSVGKRYMMLIEEINKVYMLDEGNNVFSVDHIQFPFDAEYTSHLKDTLVIGEFVFDNFNGLFKPSFWINDIVFYNGNNVSKQPFKDRLKLISESIVKIRDSAIAKNYIEKTTQPFLVKNKYFFGLSALTKLLSPSFLATIPHKVDGLFFQPENDPYMPGECPNLLKWKENLTIEFRLKISDDSSDKNRFPKKNAQLFLSKEREDIPFTKMNYTPDLEKYNNKIISCSYKGNQWHFHRLRDDRPFPNARKTADSVLNAMKRPVTREVLCDLIKNQLK